MFDKIAFKKVCMQGSISAIRTYLSSCKDQAARLQAYDELIQSKTFHKISDDQEIASFLSLYEGYLKQIWTLCPNVEQAKVIACQILSPFFHQDLKYEELEITIKDFFEQRGYGCLFGITPPYPDLYVWQKETVETIDVELPYGKEQLQLHEISDVLCGGWLDALSLHEFGTAGWVSDDGAYFFAHRYDKSSEAFRISLCKHEAQHHYDLRHFPLMPACDLEYRAKLVELIYLKSPDTLLTFLSAQKNDPSFPHLFANGKIATQLSLHFFHKEMELSKEAWIQQYPQVSKFAYELLSEYDKMIDTWDKKTSLLNKGEHA